MNKNTWIAIIVIILIIAGVWYYQNNKSAPTNGESITIGAVLSLTGDASVDGLHIQRGLEMAKEDLAARGVNVELLYEDDHTDPKQTVSAVAKIASIPDHPKAIVGPVWSFLIDAALPVINQNKLISYVPSATSEVVTGEGSYIFYGSYKNIEEVGPLTEWLKNNKKTKAAIVVSNDAWGESHIEAFNEAVSNSGGQVVLTEKINFGSDASVIPTAVAKIKNLGADVILWTGYDEAGSLLVKRVQEQSLKLPIIAAASVMEGLVNRGTVTLRPEDEVYMIDIPLDKKFREKYVKKYGEEPSTYSDSAYDGLMMLVEGLQKYPAGGDELANYMREMTYDGYLGHYDFDDKGDIVGGTWEILRLK